MIIKIIIRLILLYTTLETIGLPLIYNLYMCVCKYCAHRRSNIKKTINSRKLLIRTPHADVLYVCHMRIRNMIDHSITQCDQEKRFYDDDEWSMSILIHLPSLSFSQLEFYSSRRDQTFFIYWFVLKSSSRLKFTLLSLSFSIASQYPTKGYTSYTHK
jgi:hypothetical protein